MGACCHSQKATATVKPEPNESAANLNLSVSTMHVKEAFNVEITRNDRERNMDVMKSPPSLAIDELTHNSGLNCTALDHEPSDDSIKLKAEIRNTRNR